MTDTSLNPLVSIIVRTKDRPKLLMRALQSIAAQTYRPIEVVLVNDGGCALDNDEIRQVLGDVLLNYIHLEKNMGRSHAGNVGLEEMKGEYAGFLDDDDLFYDNHIELLIGFLSQSGADAAYSDAYMVSNKPTGEGYKPISKEVAYARNFDKDLLLFQNYIPLLCIVLSRELLLKESFDTGFDLFEDWDLLIRLSRHATFHRIPEITAEYHIRDDNMTLELNPETFPHIEARYNVYRKHMNLLTERSISIFESLHAESERNRGLTQEKERQLQEKERHLAEALDHMRQNQRAALSFLREKKEDISKGLISIIILTYNGAKYIGGLLDSVFGQEITHPMEVIVIDSSSHDLTSSILSEYDVRLHTIDKSAFSHSKTRNLAVSLSSGRFIVMITQDALPTNNYWLKELVMPFSLLPNVAATYSRQVPRPECDPIQARDIYLGAPCVDEIRHADLELKWQRDDYSSNIHRYIRFSNVSACYDGDVLRSNPFDESLKMVEDQEWSKRMLEKGFSVYYTSKSVVMHSHNFGWLQTYRRFFDYGSSFSKFLRDNPPRRISALRATLYDSVNDIFYILNDNRRLRSKIKWICKSPLMRFASNYGLYKGWKHG